MLASLVMINMDNSHTAKNKITKQAEFCGEKNRDYAACIKNAVRFIVTEIY